MHHNASAGDFISVVLIRTLPGALSRLIFAMTSPFCLAKSASWFLLQRVLSLNWIHSKIISGATFRIIGLTKTPKMEFLPLDWIYCSIRIITVHTSANAVTLVWGSKTSKSSDGFVHVMNLVS